MHDIIHLLPDSVSNQIAAGEVVQRPASIVKELIENSIDAGAQKIIVLLEEGGKNCVQVIDDGKGMSETDARLAFERHATSKILEAKDLFTLSTMGFRGEALASIAAVAQVELKTRRIEDELGTMVRISGSHIDSEEPIVCPVGCNFCVKNIFFNIPARRKFLKSAQTELSNSMAELERVALTNPDVEFVLCNNKIQIYNLQPASLKQRILDVFGKKIGGELLPVQVETPIVSIAGFVAKPESSRKKGSHQYFFVNGRFMRHPYFNSAVMHPYDNLIPKGDHVSYFLYLSVDPSSIDVNVHPTKTEIKFDNEQEIWQILAAGVKEAIGKYHEVPTIDFDVIDKPDIPAMPVVEIGHKPLNNTFTSTNNERSSAYTPFEKNKNTASQQILWDSISIDKEEIQKDNTLECFQYQGKYLVTTNSSGVMLIDQHRAHVKILYEEYLRHIQEHKSSTQGLLFPELIQFTKVEEVTLNDIFDDVINIGFDLTNLGGGSYSINGIPAGIKNVSPVKLLHDIIYAAMESLSVIRHSVNNSIAETLAKETSIKYGHILSDSEKTYILKELTNLGIPKYAPDGKPIFVIIENSTIEGLFRKK
ncbi:MAG: DNA mismatch repair endonuclease MutL [Prevotellaceae bacterium]|nr:DNA mismatch repair endonuclease MutL [Candidatus Colivivens equi]